MRAGRLVPRALGVRAVVIAIPITARPQAAVPEHADPAAPVRFPRRLNCRGWESDPHDLTVTGF